METARALPGPNHVPTIARSFARATLGTADLRTAEAMAAHIHQFLCLKDNFGVLLHDPATRATAAIDAPDADPILAALAAREWNLTDILITHHHFDHVQGIAGLKERFPRARVVGPAKEAAKIGHLDFGVEEGSGVMAGALEARVIEV